MQFYSLPDNTLSHNHIQYILDYLIDLPFCLSGHCTKGSINQSKGVNAVVARGRTDPPAPFPGPPPGESPGRHPSHPKQFPTGFIDLFQPREMWSFPGSPQLRVIPEG